MRLKRAWQNSDFSLILDLNFRPLAVASRGMISQHGVGQSLVYLHAVALISVSWKLNYSLRKDIKR